MKLIDADLFAQSASGQAAFIALSSLGYQADRVAGAVKFAYRNGSVRQATIGAVAYTGVERRLEEASVVVHPVARTRDCKAAVDAMGGMPAPFFLLHNERDNAFRLWFATVDALGRRNARPAIADPISADRLTDALNDYRGDLSPNTVADVRVGRAKFESEVFRSIDPLQLLLLSEAANESTIVSHFSHALSSLRSGRFEEDRAGQLALQLLAWRVLVDRGILPDSTEVEAILPAATKEGLESYFTWTKNESKQSSFAEAAELIRKLVFNAFEVDMLRAIYQKTFSRETARLLGRFDTPLWLTRRIMEHIPVENLAPNQRQLADMTCGWGSFLVAGYERLKALPDVHRPRQLVRQIHGNEGDALTAGLARLALLLVSGHNTWQVNNGDALKWDRLRPGSLDIVVGNPPFRTEPGAESRSDYASGFIERAIDALAPNGYLGMVMPASFEVKGVGSKVREKLLREIDILDLWRLPGDVFKGTPERATVIIGQKRTGSGAARVQETPRGSMELQSLRRGSATATNFAPNTRNWVSNTVSTRGRSDSRAVFQAYTILDEGEWARLGARTLSDIAYIVYGLVEGSSDRARNRTGCEKKREWFLKANNKAVRPFDLRIKDRYQITFPHDLEEPGLGDAGDGKSKYELMKEEKVVIPATLRQDWGPMIPAAVDRTGTLFSNNFWCLIPKPAAKEEGITPEAIALLLNWWVANAWIAEYRQFPAPSAGVLARIPVPATRDHMTWSQISRLGRKAEKTENSDTPEVCSVLLDAFGLTEQSENAVRMRDVFRWKSIRTQRSVLNEETIESVDTLAVAGHTVRVNTERKNFVVWLDLGAKEHTLPLSSNVPGWALRPNAQFSALAILGRQRKVLQIRDIKPEPFAYLSDEELTDQHARRRKDSAS